LDWCPYCQRWVEPVKGNWDLALGTLVGGLPGLIAGGAYHVFKGSRCPICNNVIKGSGTRQPNPPNMIPRMIPAVASPSGSPQTFYAPPPGRFSHLAPHQWCPYCHSDLVWEPHIGQWYCLYCRILPFQRPTPILRP
jgi:hypothetical protein